MPYEMPAVCVSRSRMVIARLAATTERLVSTRTATVVWAKSGMNLLTGSLSETFPSSTSDMMATLVSAFVCDAIRKIASGVMRRLASLSDQPKARS